MYSKWIAYLLLSFLVILKFETNLIIQRDSLSRFLLISVSLLSINNQHRILLF